MSTILLSHGSGGKMQNDLISDIILKHLSDPVLDKLEDSAVLAEKIAFSTDSYVIHPVFFPGGNIGKLAVAGTVNDLLCSGARPKYVSMGLIIEEGFLQEDLERILASARQEADQAGVRIVCGDTKVVHKGAADGIFINTAGIGFFKDRQAFSSARISPGDQIILSGEIADHGVCILMQREGLEFSSPIQSDCASLTGLLEAAEPYLPSIKYIRDATRGGLGGVLAELAASCRLGMDIREQALPVNDATRGACELLGLDPLYVANEGKIAIFADAAHASKLCAALRHHPFGANAAVIGEVTEAHPEKCVMETVIGGRRIVDLPRGELLPRIC